MPGIEWLQKQTLVLILSSHLVKLLQEAFAHNVPIEITGAVYAIYVPAYTADHLGHDLISSSTLRGKNYFVHTARERSLDIPVLLFKQFILTVICRTYCPGVLDPVLSHWPLCRSQKIYNIWSKQHLGTLHQEAGSKQRNNYALWFLAWVQLWPFITSPPKHV